jgi:hypothetical protein
MKNKKTKDLYAGRFFYKIERTILDQQIKLVGPLDTIRYATPKTFKNSGYKFVQIVDGIIRCAFKKNEILITLRRL